MILNFMRPIIGLLLFLVHQNVGLSKKEAESYRLLAKRMFYHAYDGYMKYAFPYDELRPITCDGHDTWGSYSLTLIDALDTLAIMGNKTEFQKVAGLVLERVNFESDINVSVFETNIRIVGGLVSAHLMYKRMGMELEPGYPCSGPLLRLAETVAKKLLPAFHTKTGMPYGTVNLMHGVPYGETPITCTAGTGTFLVEFGALSRLTGDPIYEQVALRAMLAAWRQRSSIDLLGNHIDVTTGRWTALDSGIGAGVDSYFEYLVKGAALLQRPELMQIFESARAAIDLHLKHDDWYLWVTMTRGHVTMPVFQSLEAFWPGVLTLAGDLEAARKTIHNYHQVWRQYGFTPESYNIPQAEAGSKREGYPLRPELIESIMYLFRATADRSFLDMGADIITSIEHSTKTHCGYATVKNVRNHQLENRMESFFLAETIKYLYLLFAEDHWMHNNGASGTVWKPKGKPRCVLDAGGYIFNSEAHPVDPGALSCCTSDPSTDPDRHWLSLSAEELAEIILDPSAPWPQASGPTSDDEQNSTEATANSTKADDIAVDTKNDEGTSVEEKTDFIEGSPKNDSQEKNDISRKATLPDYEENNSDADMPGRYEEKASVEQVKQEALMALSEMHRRSRYATPAVPPKEPPTPSDDDSELNDSFDSSYEVGEKADHAVDSEEIPRAKTQISKDTKELETDSNLTAPDRPAKETSTKTDLRENTSAVTLNLPRFGAIIASGDNESDGLKSTMEKAGISTSVSSSKYSNPSTRVGIAGAKIVKDLLQPILEKKPKSIQPPGPSLRDEVVEGLAEYNNFTSRAPYSLLSCPHVSYATLLSFKGQIIEKRQV
ncbi:Glycoside hydrolase family 47 [Trinorchestia longiramus]|nr:Glycoside hydrolase family 47 [Trinorchestia longiramus]